MDTLQLAVSVRTSSSRYPGRSDLPNSVKQDDGTVRRDDARQWSRLLSAIFTSMFVTALTLEFSQFHSEQGRMVSTLFPLVSLRPMAGHLPDARRWKGDSWI
jgi:hypothetical protein